MHKISFGLFAGAAILAATAVVYAQSATPIEGNPSIVRPAPSGTCDGRRLPPQQEQLRIPLLRKLRAPGICRAATQTGLPARPKPTSLRPDNSRASRH